MKRIAAALILTAFALPAHAAEECTEADAEKLSEEVIAFIQKNPDSAQKIEGIMAEIEKEYGGEPSQEQVCEALDKLLKRLPETK